MKVAIVYLHDKGAFAVWLSARNRDIAKSYASYLDSATSYDLGVFRDEDNPDAILECILTSTPNFEGPSTLLDLIDQGVEKSITFVSDRLQMEFCLQISSQRYTITWAENRKRMGYSIRGLFSCRGISKASSSALGMCPL